MRTSGAVLKVAVTPMGHLEVHCVRPKWRVPQRSCDGRIIEEGLLLHHGELTVASNPEVGSTKPNHRVVSDVGKLVDDQPCEDERYNEICEEQPTQNRVLSEEECRSPGYSFLATLL